MATAEAEDLSVPPVTMAVATACALPSPLAKADAAACATCWFCSRRRPAHTQDHRAYEGLGSSFRVEDLALQQAATCRHASSCKARNDSEMTMAAGLKYACSSDRWSSKGVMTLNNMELGVQNLRAAQNSIKITFWAGVCGFGLMNVSHADVVG